MANEEYGMFNGRRNADKYVATILKVIMWLTGIALTLMFAFGGWVVVKIGDAQKFDIGIDNRVTSIEASRFTVLDGQKLGDKINANTISFSRIEQTMVSVSRDLDEIKSILKRSAN